MAKHNKEYYGSFLVRRNMDKVKNLVRYNLAGVMLLFLGGCSIVGPDFSIPEAPVAETWRERGKANEQTTISMAEEETAHKEWWRVFNDEVLNSLIKKAYEGNLTLRVAGLRVLEARARLGFAEGMLYPQQQALTADASTNGLSKNDTVYGPEMDRYYPRASIGFEAGWEIDFWGKFRRAIQSTDAALNAEVASYDDMLVALTAEVARAYITIRTFNERIRIGEENIKIQKQSLHIATINFKNGNTTELDAQQAKSLLYNTEAAIPEYRLGLHQAQHGLSVLLGLPPQSLAVLLQGTTAIPTAPASIAVGLPADLLRRRPDIQKAEFIASAKCANVGVAESALYPHISLVGSMGFSSIDSGDKELNDLFNSDSIGFTFGPAMRWDIFNYGRLKNQIRTQDAVFEQAITEYQNTVLNAAREVEDNMAAFLFTTERARSLNQSVTASKRAANISRIQYREGLVDYQRVLDTDRYLAGQEDSYIIAKGDIALHLIGLYKALGGGWQMRLGNDFVPQDIQEKMSSRTDWGQLIDRN